MVEKVNPQNVEFWFDPACPWCWMTSRWLTEVSEVRGFDVTWNSFSLHFLNEGRDMPADKHEQHLKMLAPLRVIEKARELHGDAVIGKLYTELGTRIHPGGRSDIDEIIAEALAAADLPADLAEVAHRVGDEEDELDARLRASTARALDLVGRDVGIPIIAVDGHAFFGPVVSPAPTGDAALKLFDGVVAAAGVEGFYELKRTRDVGPQF